MLSKIANSLIIALLFW